jgi:hypothetical protein
MNFRAASFLSDQCVSRFANLVEASGRRDFDKVRGNSKLKEAICSDPLIRAEVLSGTSFCVYELDEFGEKTCGPIINSALIEDFIIGCRRVSEQYKSLLSAKQSRVSIAWMLVTAYYCAFFSSIEISRLYGRFSAYYDPSDLCGIMGKCTLNQHATEFFERPPSNYIGKTNGNRIVFTSAGQKPHAFAWSNFGTVLREAYSGRSWIDAQNLIAIVTAQNNPSVVRNDWNYKFADRFGPAGERLGRSFPKLIGNKDGVSAWLKNTDWLKRGDQGVAESIAALCETSSTAIIEASTRISVANILDFA